MVSLLKCTHDIKRTVHTYIVLETFYWKLIYKKYKVYYRKRRDKMFDKAAVLIFEVLTIVTVIVVVVGLPLGEMLVKKE